VDRIRGLGWQGVQGNTDEMLWFPQRRAELSARYPQRAPFFDVMFGEVVPYALEQLGADRIDWLRQQPLTQHADGLALVHAKPQDLWEAPAPDASDADFAAGYSELNAPLVVYGHIHRSHVRRLESGITVANSGSVSLSFDGDPRASYLLATGGVPEIRRVPYDVEREIGALERCGIGRAGWIASILRAASFVAP
jgi:diadenosine tetraphosphatase ApaH/serine/threonine PP2A family protein phosphatase